MAVVLDVFADILIKKLVNLAEEEVGMLLGVEDEVEKMKRTMEMIRDLLLDADQNDSSNESRSATKLVKELKNVMYDADDILDICMMQLRQQNLASVHSPFNCFSSCVRCLKYRHQIADDIQKLNIRMEEIIRETGVRKTVRSVINNNNINPPSQRVVPDISFMSATLNLVGQAIEDNADELIAGIVRNDEARCVIFAITGMGGIGKTTLASKIYSDERIASNFPKRILLRISKTYSEINVLKELIRNLRGSHGEAQSREELETKLASIQLPESLFLVLDDLWNSDVWYKLLKVHMNRVTKCKILVTTRHDTVARSLLASIHHVGRMNKESCWELLRKEVFQDDREQDIRLLEPIGYKIVEKCDGLPLAVKAVAGILRTKERRSVEWEGVLASDIWTMSEINDEVPRALYLSYKDLSPQLKQCFLYCSFLAISGEVNKSDIILYWIDEGLVMDGEHASREDKAEECYRKLIWRNLLQPDPYYVDGSICTMHDLLQSLGRFLIGGEAICIKEGKRVGAEASINLFKVRRLLINSDSSEILMLPTDFNPQHLRAFFLNKCLQTRVEVGLLERLRNLRILVLRGLNIQELPNSIGKLLHLKHLDLDESNITKIPDSIGNLGNLQTFSACGCVSLHQLPITITRLHKLRSLLVGNNPLTHVPKGIGQLRNLNRIAGLVIGHSGDLIEEQENACQVHEIQNLTNLRVLGLHMLHRSRNGATTTLADKKFLKRLSLSESLLLDGEAPTLSEEQIRRSQKIYNYLSPPSCLEELRIYNFPAVELPIWMMSTSLRDSFPNLTTLFIGNARSCQELPPDLCQLPELKCFIIEGNDSIIKIVPEFFGSKREIVAFPKLEYLSVKKFTKLEDWSTSLEPSSLPLLPKLNWLEIDGCPKLKALPECLSLATNLKKLVIYNCPSLVFVEKLPALEEFRFITFVPKLPLWLPRLVLQPQLKKFCMDCNPALFQKCLRNGRHWRMIEQIPYVLIKNVKSDKCMSYTKRNSGSYYVSEGDYVPKRDHSLRLSNIMMLRSPDPAK